MSVFVQSVFAADTSSEPERIQTLVAKIVAAYGGKKVIEETTSVSAIGDIEALMRQNRGSYELSFKRPRKLRGLLKQGSWTVTPGTEGRMMFPFQKSMASA